MESRPAWLMNFLSSFAAKLLLIFSFLHYRLTTFTGVPAKNAFKLSTAIAISRARDSLGAQAICGVIIQFLAVNNGLSASIGSVATTSTAALYTLPLFNAAARSSSTTNGPLEVSCFAQYFRRK